jgi:hypothetical protein
MFRNLGEVLVAGYHPRGYAAVLLRVQEDRIPVAQACVEVLGFEYDEAAKVVAAHWRIPESVTDCMTARVRLRRSPSTDAERLEAAVHFAHRLTNAVYRRDASAARASLNLLLDSHGPALNLTHDAVKTIVERALEETKEVFQAMSVPMDHLRLKRLTEAALRPLEENEPQPEPGSEPEVEPETLATLLRDVAAQVDRETGDLKAITRMVLEALYRGGPFDRVLFAVVDEESRRLVGKIGFGESIEALLQNFNFKVIGESTPVASAVLNREDVLVAGPRDRRFEGTRFRQTVGAPIFGLYPVIARGGAVVGCLYFDRQEQKHFDTQTLAAIGALRDQLCRALAKSRSGSALTTAGPAR